MAEEEGARFRRIWPSGVWILRTRGLDIICCFSVKRTRNCFTIMIDDQK